MADMPIVLPDGTHVPASPGKYRVEPSLDLNEVDERRFLLEYDSPFLVVKELAMPPSSSTEQLEAVGQAGNWRVQHSSVGGRVFGDRAGYQFNQPSSSRARGYRQQFIPSISYVDKQTWTRLSPDDKHKAYTPCVPTVVIELVSETDKMEDLQRKVAKFVNAGTREGVVVDTRRDQVWICNRNEQPHFAALAPVEFESWPGFTLDCPLIRDARIQYAE